MGKRSGLRSWGPAGWTFLHVVSWTYPENPTNQEREEMYVFLHAFSKVLPCKRCRRHWTESLVKAVASSESPHLSSRAALTRFIVDAHNDVNRRLGKRVLSYDEARRLFDPQAPLCFIDRWKGPFTMVGLVLLVVVFFRMCRTSAQARSKYMTSLRRAGSVQ